MNTVEIIDQVRNYLEHKVDLGEPVNAVTDEDSIDDFMQDFEDYLWDVS